MPIVVSRPGPGLVHVRAVIYGGAGQDPPGAEGMTELLWRTATRGAGKRDHAAFSRALHVLGADLDVQVAGEHVVVAGTVLADGADAFLPLVADLLLRPRLDPDEVDAARSLLLDEVRSMRDDDARLARDAAFRFAWRGHPLGRTRQGTAASLAPLGPEQLRKHHARLLARGVTLGLAGAVTRAQGNRWRKRYFAEMPARRTGKALAPPKRPEGRRLLVLHQPGRRQAQVVVALPTVGAGDRHLWPMQVAATAFGGAFSSRLVRELRELRGWVYGIDATLHTSARHGLLVTQWATANEHVADSLDLVTSLLVELRQSGLTEAEVAFARDHLRGAHRLAVEAPADELDERLLARVLRLGDARWDAVLREVAAVDRAAVAAALDKACDPRRLVAVIVGDHRALRDSLGKLASGFAVDVLPVGADPNTSQVVGRLPSDPAPPPPIAAAPPPLDEGELVGPGEDDEPGHGPGPDGDPAPAADPDSAPAADPDPAPKPDIDEGVR